MKLYYSPGACSLGIHVLLEEIGQPYELQRLNFAEDEQHKPRVPGDQPARARCRPWSATTAAC